MTIKSSERLAKGPRLPIRGVSAILTMRLENLCERGARILQIEIMGAFIGVGLNLLRSVAFGVMARDVKVLASTQAVLYTMPNGAKPG